MSHPVIVVGAGLAGLSTALALAPLPVLLVATAPLGAEAASAWAQGGIAAAIGPDDSPQSHAADTIAAGDGLCDPATVDRITQAGPSLIASLAAAGVRFDPGLGLEAAHAHRRIVHAGDHTGREIMRALAARTRATPFITLLQAEASALILNEGVIAGLRTAQGTAIAASRIVLATGGIGGLYAHTTNPRGAWGHGLALAARAGAVLRDLEFVQFHPTALDIGADPMPLVSEAVRGEGAILIDETGHRFMAAIPHAELAPRDVVARAVWAHLSAGHRVYLDARTALGAGFRARFPTIAAFCAQAGIDPARQPIPIRPAAHYHMGGIEVDGAGRTSIPGLFACGECAATGLHGANRLASNSLLEAGVCGAAIAAAIAAHPAPPPTRLLAPVWPCPPIDPAQVRPIMAAGLGVLRDEAGIAAAAAALLRLADGRGPAAEPAAIGLAIAISALRRQESRGAHARADYPGRDVVAKSSRITLADAFDEARKARGAAPGPSWGQGTPDPIGLRATFAGNTTSLADEWGSGAFGPSGVQGQRPWPSALPHG